MSALLTIVALLVPVGFGYWLGAEYGGSCDCDER